MNGTIDAIEKDSRTPFNINKKIKKYNCLFLFLLKKKNSLYKGFVLIENIFKISTKYILSVINDLISFYN